MIVGSSPLQTVVKLLNANLGAEEQQHRARFLQPYDTSLFDNYVRGSLTQGSEFIDEDVTQEVRLFCISKDHFYTTRHK